MQRAVVFLIGLHGCGKTTVGKELQRTGISQHFSLGDLGRLARARKLPAEFSLRLMCQLAGMVRGVPVGEATSQELMRNIISLSQSTNVSFDGFPAEPAHISLLPNSARVVVLEVEEAVRMQRLTQRSDHSVRKWTAGLPSQRDTLLPDVVEALGSRCIRVDANRSVTEVANTVSRLFE